MAGRKPAFQSDECLNWVSGYSSLRAVVGVEESWLAVAFRSRNTRPSSIASPSNSICDVPCEKGKTVNRKLYMKCRPEPASAHKTPTHRGLHEQQKSEYSQIPLTAPRRHRWQSTSGVAVFCPHQYARNYCTDNCLRNRRSLRAVAARYVRIRDRATPRIRPRTATKVN